jgi:hypothetical protein
MPYKDRETRLAYYRKRYQDRRDEFIPMQAAYRAAHQEERKEYFDRRYARFAANLQLLKRTQGCAVCGRKDGKLDYHHRIGTTKKHTIGSMHNCSLEEFINEIGKCIVLCGSCHARHHKLLQLGREPLWAL